VGDDHRATTIRQAADGCRVRPELIPTTANMLTMPGCWHTHKERNRKNHGFSRVGGMFHMMLGQAVGFDGGRIA